MLVLAPHRYQTLPTEASTTPNSRYAVQTSTVVLVAREGLGSIGCLEKAQFGSVVLSTAVSCVEVEGCRFVFANRHPCVWNLDRMVLVLAPHRYGNLPTEANTTPVSQHAYL